ncbi:polymeric immunoglobulin receptor-like, partial [Hoplias malabaricus]|uniref:polymeric immunoglobulin receptor-like n=1 Tax=Hoplias malabaricus TaxID=27720 RepID=UPI003462BAFE
KTLRNVAVKSGGSLTIPCFYDEQYKSNPKYWCKGKYWYSCGIVARTNTSGRTSVTDYPTQNMFTVELNSLQISDSGDYWCAVEIKDGPDDGDYLYLMVIADPAVSVINSRVSGQEGGSVSVRCLYRTDYKNKQKQWCRFRDWSCLTSQNSAVQISDDGRGAVSVEMSGLKRSDAGWYWFSAGEVAVTVHLSVTERPTTTTAVTTFSSTEKNSNSETTSGVTPSIKNEKSTTANKKTAFSSVKMASSAETAEHINHSTNNKSVDKKPCDLTDCSNGNSKLIWILLAVGLGLLLLLVCVITFILRKLSKASQTESRERSSNSAVHTTCTAEDSVTYSTVIPKKKISTSEVEDSVTYSTIIPQNKKLSPAAEDDAVIYSSVLHK